jgi:hypothetical protein
LSSAAAAILGHLKAALEDIETLSDELEPNRLEKGGCYPEGSGMSLHNSGLVTKIDNLSAKSKRARDNLDHIPRLTEKYKQVILAAAFR